MSRAIIAAVPLALGIVLASTQFAHSQVAMGGFVAARDRVFNSPSVSPYLSLLSQDDSYGVPNYFTRVKPRLEAEPKIPTPTDATESSSVASQSNSSGT